MEMSSNPLIKPEPMDFDRDEEMTYQPVVELKREIVNVPIYEMLAPECNEWDESFGAQNDDGLGAQSESSQDSESVLGGPVHDQMLRLLQATYMDVLSGKVDACERTENEWDVCAKWGLKLMSFKFRTDNPAQHDERETTGGNAASVKMEPRTDGAD